MDVITNPKSTTIKKIQALLTSRKKRVQYGQVVVEGPRMIRDLLCLEKAPSLPPSYSKQQHQQSIPGCNNGSRSIIQQIIVDVDKYDLYKPMLLSSPSVVATTTTVEDAATAAAASSSVPPVILASPDVLAACTDTVQTQGIVAICNLPDWTRTPHQKPSYSSKCRYPLVLVLDGVADPGNVGTLIRSAVACGASALYLLPDCCDPWNAKALRSAMGTTFSIPIYTMDSWRDCREELIQRHCCTVSTIFAATMWRQEEQDHDSAPLLRNDSSLGTGASTVSSHSSVSHYDVDWCPDRHLDVVADEEDNDDDSAAVLSTSSSTGRRGSALVIGNEGHGLSSSLRQSLLDREISAVHIPMQPGSVESLNAAVCGSVILFEYYRQTQQQSLDTSLSSSSQSKQP